ncbi:MAG: hypothetical protein GC178_14375 [Flavobacteriales bacterium]|nr:hypothetical protein [Flavobacteriales bacterium]
MLTRKRLPFSVALILILELSIYLWSVWTSTLDPDSFFAIEPQFIWDKCARLAGRVSTAMILIALLMVGYYGLRKIYGDEKKKESFLVLLTLFTCNHLIHLLFVILRFRSHGESLGLGGPVTLGGMLHGAITFASIIVVPFILWNYKHLSRLLYGSIILYLLNISSFIVKTFFDKVAPPEHPAYHNQLGIALIIAGCMYVLYRTYIENMQSEI